MRSVWFLKAVAEVGLALSIIWVLTGAGWLEPVTVAAGFFILLLTIK